MTARDTLIWFGIGTPICMVLLVLLDRIANPVPRRVYLDEPAAPRKSSTFIDAPPIAERSAVPPRAGRRPVPTIVASIEPPRPAHHPWAPSDGLRRPLAGGAKPSAATVRKRAWTAYATIADERRYGAANIERLRRGRPPLRFNPHTGTLEAMSIDIDEIGHARPYWSDVEHTIDPFSVIAAKVPA